jgi:hypothetical protein
VPAIIASQARGEINIPREDLGAPLRLKMDSETGLVKLNSSGLPVTTLSKGVKGVISNTMKHLEATLIDSITRGVTPEEYAQELQACKDAAKEIVEKQALSIQVATLALQKQNEPSETPAPESTPEMELAPQETPVEVGASA